LLRAAATFGCSFPKLFSSMASARRISGSALLRRFVAWSNVARLLRSLATLGCSLPKFFSSMASARRISGSASAHSANWWSDTASQLSNTESSPRRETALRKVSAAARYFPCSYWEAPR